MMMMVMRTRRAGGCSRRVFGLVGVGSLLVGTATGSMATFSDLVGGSGARRKYGRRRRRIKSKLNRFGGCRRL